MPVVSAFREFRRVKVHRLPCWQSAKDFCTYRCDGWRCRCYRWHRRLPLQDCDQRLFRRCDSANVGPRRDHRPGQIIEHELCQPVLYAQRERGQLFDLPSLNGGAFKYLVTTFDSTPPSTMYCYEDTGYNANGQGWGNSTTVKPDWLPSTVPSGATNDWCQTTIAGGAGTTAITLSGACTSVTGQIVKHDDTAAVQAAVNACNTTAGGIVNFDLNSNFTFGNVNWPDTRTHGRGWIILDIQGQITITYPLTFGSPVGTGYSQNKIRITGGTGGSAAQSQFPWANTGHINSGFVSPVIHTVYQNSTPLYPFEFDHISIFNRGIGGGDGIVVDGGNSGGTYVNNVDISASGTPLKVGYLPGANGPCSSCRKWIRLVCRPQHVQHFVPRQPTD